MVPARQSSSQVCKTRFLSVHAETGGINREVPFILARALRVACRRALVALSRGQSARPRSGFWLPARLFDYCSGARLSVEMEMEVTRAQMLLKQPHPASPALCLSLPSSLSALLLLLLSPCTATGGCQDARQTAGALQVWTLGP